MEQANSSSKELINGSTGLQDIRDDLYSVKASLKSVNNEIATLAHDIKHGGSAILKEGVNHVKNAGKDEFRRMEDHVREKPGQSIALAFCAGLIFSYIVGGRR